MVFENNFIVDWQWLIAPTVALMVGIILLYGTTGPFILKFSSSIFTWYVSLS